MIQIIKFGLVFAVIIYNLLDHSDFLTVIFQKWFVLYIFLHEIERWSNLKGIIILFSTNQIAISDIQISQTWELS